MTVNNPPKLGAILLAAGGSSRLGRPKQILKYKGETLLKRSARLLSDSVYEPVVVVLGAEHEVCLAEFSGLRIYDVINEQWADGMSSSILAGLAKLREIEPEVTGVLITLCDQPSISVDMLNRFAETYKVTNAPIIAARYGGVAGVPALFSDRMFDELSRLEGDQGARRLIRNRKDVKTIDLPEAALDIDTVDDLSKLE